jgi:hypothetical protein
MELVDSRSQTLNEQGVIFGAIQQLRKYQDLPMATRLAMVAAEGTVESAEPKQFGNTMFLSHRGTGNNSNKMAGHIFNMDIDANFAGNIRQYIMYLQAEGITHYTVLFEEEYLSALQAVQELVKNVDTKMGIGQDEDDDYMAFIKPGMQPIPEGL